jgi:transcriptional regulator with XRE-family HTH domain
MANILTKNFRYLAKFQYIINMEKLEFWKRVKRLISAHRISHEKFAAYIGVPSKTLSGWIYLDRIPDAYTAHDIASALGTTVEYLVTGIAGQAAELRSRQTEERKRATEKLKKLLGEFQEAVSRL